MRFTPSSLKIFLAALLFLVVNLPAELAHREIINQAAEGPHPLAEKVFPLFTELTADSIFFAAICKDNQLANLRKRYFERVTRALDTCANAHALAQQLKWKEEEINLVAKRFTENELHGSRFMLRINKSRACIAYKNKDTKALLQQSWHDAAHGMNRIYDVYIAGKPPAYAAIDSIMTDLRSESGFNNLRASITQVLKENENNGLFYSLPVSLATMALQLSARDEATRYEPITGGINKQACEQVAKTHFSQYPYSAILVPGFGPEEPGLNIDPRSIRRCEMAVEHFRKKLAPFIIVSGGHVYPAGTAFSEAVEMKKYLIGRLGIAPEAIITEPYARHTTTNVRNASRLVYLFALPQDKPVLVSTDSVQTQMVINLAARCKRELGFVPFRNVKQLSTTVSSFFPVEEAFQVNVNDPLDP